MDQPRLGGGEPQARVQAFAQAVVVIGDLLGRAVGVDVLADQIGVEGVRPHDDLDALAGLEVQHIAVEQPVLVAARIAVDKFPGQADAERRRRGLRQHRLRGGYIVLPGGPGPRCG